MNSDEQIDTDRYAKMRHAKMIYTKGYTPDDSNVFFIRFYSCDFKSITNINENKLKMEVKNRRMNDGRKG